MDVARSAQQAGATQSGVFSQKAFSYDVSRLGNDDLRSIIPIVAVLIAVLTALVLRSVVAPLYLVLSVVLSYLAALGHAAWSLELVAVGPPP